MTAAASTIVRQVSPLVDAVDQVGNVKSEIVDIKWASTIANGTADKTLKPTDFGFVAFVGADFLGDVGVKYSGTDTIGQVTFTFDTDGYLVVAALTAAGVALDLDNNDIAVARVRVLGL